MLKQIFYTALLSCIAHTFSADISSEIKLRNTSNIPTLIKMYDKNLIDSINNANAILAQMGEIYLRIYLRDDQKGIKDFYAVRVPLLASIGDLVGSLKKEISAKKSDTFRLYPWCTPLAKRVVIMPVEEIVECAPATRNTPAMKANNTILNAIQENKTISFTLEKE